MEWLPWLERQAALGNEAAISALRGLRYRAQRDKNKQKAGIEGEDLGHIQTAASQENGIRGTVRPDHFDIRTAQLRITPEHTALNTLTPSGQVRLTDSGPRIDLTKENDHRPCTPGCCWPLKNTAARCSSQDHFRFGSWLPKKLCKWVFKV
jgi:hypothetical protein